MAHPMNPVRLDKDFLLSVMKPARYIGHEIGAVAKDWAGIDVKFCLCFPDIYEIGMSHMGLRVLYDLINRRPDALAERVFSPWTDMEERLKEKGIPLFSLESRMPVRAFDIVGFSLSYELSYTNVLNILSLSGIPLKSSERSDNDPLIIAGGGCCLNPEPLAEFIDAFCIGEGEEAAGEIIEVYRAHSGKGRESLLGALARVPGIYVPSFHGAARTTIKKRFTRDLASALDLQRWVVSYIEIVHDRLGIEIMRGCPHRCRFCQARACFYPLRIVPRDKVVATARRLYRLTGYEEISLLSLSSSDHPGIGAIARDLLDEFREKGVGISLPSVRAKTVVGDLSECFAAMRKTSLTFAPEAGSERLRQVLQKDFALDEFLSVARQSFEAGYRLLKLYFMIGLPTETEEDLDAIAQLCVRVSQLKKEVDGHPANLNVSVSNFVPKPHTAFQREAMCDAASLARKQEYLKGLLHKHRGLIHLKFHNTEMSRMEGILSRGDRSISRVILAAFRAGARFDAWDSHFNPAIWREAMRESGVEAQDFLEAKPAEVSLPWSFIDAGPGFGGQE